MKKSLWIALLLILVCVFTLSACDTGNTPDDTTGNSQEAHTHSFSEWSITKNATCTEDGLQERSCACGEKETQAISANGHTEVVDNATTSTCKENGKSEGKHCSVCGIVIVEQISLPLTNHTYDNDNDEKCNVCEFVRVIGCTHAQTEVLEAVAATCTTSGLTEGKKCSDCGEILIEQTLLLPSEHTYDNDADETCNICDFVRVIGCTHTQTEVLEAVAATCTTSGLTEGKKCSDCGEILVAQTNIPSPGHSISNNKCSVCGETFEPQKQVVDLIMFMGQSNMAGRGVASQAPIVPEGYGYEFRAMSDPTKLYPIQEPFGKNENNSSSGVTESKKTGSMVSAFVNAYYAERNVPVVAVSCSKGGTGMSFWAPGGAALNDAIDRHNRAKAWLENNGYTIGKDFMVWCQGETDAGNNMTGTVYTQKLTAMIEEMIDKAGIEFCAVVRIGNTKTNPTLYDEIIRAQTELCKSYSKAVLVSTKLAGFAARGMMKDTYHFTQAGYNEVGEDAGKNAAYYVKTGTEPSMHDPEYDNTYPTDPLPPPPEIPPVQTTTELEFLFDSTSENGIDLSEIGTVKNGAITITSSSNKNNGIKLSEAIEISPDQSFTIEFICDFTSAPNVILGNGTTKGGFLYLNETQLRLRNADKTVELNGSVSKGGSKTHFAIVYDAPEKELTMYQDYKEISVTKTTGDFDNFETVTFTTLFGGYNSKYKFQGTMYYLKYVSQDLDVSELHRENA